jgi:hypothetical protein
MASEELKGKEFLEDDAGIQNDGDGIMTNISEAKRKRVLRKLDVHLLPFISTLYLLSFL